MNYRKLNAITKNNRYLILLIAETIARLFKTKWMTKIDIRHAFNRICMHFKENENLITFKIKYETYKYLIMFFELINNVFYRYFDQYDYFDRARSTYRSVFQVRWQRQRDDSSHIFAIWRVSRLFDDYLASSEIRNELSSKLITITLAS